MRELVYYVAVSLDGFIAAPDGDFSAFPVDGDHAAWLATEYGDALPAHVHSAIGSTAPGTRFDAVIQGWNSYRLALDIGMQRPYAHLDEYVATRRDEVAPAGVTFTADPVATVRELKRRKGLDIYLCGGGALAGSLLDEIDRLVLKRYPITLGSGIGLFGDATPRPQAWNLVSSRSFESGLVLMEYAR